MITSTDPEVQQMLDSMQVQDINEFHIKELMIQIFTRMFDEHLIELLRQKRSGATELLDHLYVPVVKPLSKLSIVELHACMEYALLEVIANRWEEYKKTPFGG